MAYSINQETRAQGWPEFRFPASHFEWADQSFGGVSGGGAQWNESSVTVATSGSGDCLTGMRYFRALVYIKTHVVGTATINGRVMLEVADNATFVTNRTVLGAQSFDQLLASTAAVQCVQVYGIAPTALRQYVRVRIQSNGTESGSYDAVIDAV